MFDNLTEFGFIRVSSASPELRVCDTDFNGRKIIESIQLAKNEGAKIIVFPELSVTGYSCGDLFYQEKLLTASLETIVRIANASADYDIVSIVGAPIRFNNNLFNCAVVIYKGEILGIVPKIFIPDTNEFYEKRWFSSGSIIGEEEIEIGGKKVMFSAHLLFELKNYQNIRFGIEICEDLWSVIPPSSNHCLAGALIIFNLSASNEVLGKYNYRKELIKSQSGRCICAYCYANAGPNESTTDTLFSGHCLIAENGIILSESRRFDFNSSLITVDIDFERLIKERIKNISFKDSKALDNYKVVDIDLGQLKAPKLLREISQTPFIPSREEERKETCKEIFAIQSTALAKRLRHLGISDVVLGISGGLDSTLALLISVNAFNLLGLNLSGIHCISMPGFGTSRRTKSNAQRLARLLGVDYRAIPINRAVKLHFQDIGFDESKLGIVYENAQARERMQILMDFANMVNGIVIGTGDLSEIALGWATYNGDHMSMYGVNSGIPKTLVKYLIQWSASELFSGKVQKVLYDISSTPITPELLPLDGEERIVQLTEEKVGPYILNDFFLYYIIRFNYSPRKVFFLAQTAFKEDFESKEILHWLKNFYIRFFTQQFKRSCMPDGIKVGSVALSPRADWRMPSDAEYSIWLEELNSIEVE